jgi:hypothetical protein
MVISKMKGSEMGSKGQSMIISSVLLILLVVIVTFIIIGFVVPFVKNQLSGTDCFAAVDKVKIINSAKYSCYNSSKGGEMNVQIRISDDDIISGFSIELGGASTNSYEIKDGTSDSDVKMFGGNYDDLLEIPGKNEERTYVINSSVIPESVRVYPRLEDGRSCESAQEVNKIISCE